LPKWKKRAKERRKRAAKILSAEFDERDPGVMKIMTLAVQGSKMNGRHSGICGQAPSDYPEIAEFLIKTGNRFDLT
jgi:pyruvate,water dikinase